MATRFFLALTLSILIASSAAAQGTFGNRTLGGGVQGSSGGQFGSGGTRQTGTVQAAGAIQRDSTGFVGASSSSMNSIRSMQDAGTGLGGLGGLGVGGLGMGGLGGVGLGGLGVGGLGGYGMGMGGYGMGMGMGGYGMGMNRGGMRGGQYGRQGMGQNQQQQRRSVNAPLRLGFAAPTIAPTVVATRFQQRLTRIPQIRDAGQVQIQVVDGIAILEGVVATDDDRDLIERLAMLEPGIDAVQNDLQIDPTAASVTEVP